MPRFACPRSQPPCYGLLALKAGSRVCQTYLPSRIVGIPNQEAATNLVEKPDSPTSSLVRNPEPQFRDVGDGYTNSYLRHRPLSPEAASPSSPTLWI